MPKPKPTPVEPGPAKTVPCPYCGKPADPDYLFECPGCYRDGCESCMPAGRNCLCPECEEAGGPEEDED